MPKPRQLADQTESETPETSAQASSKTGGKNNAKDKTFMDRWVEPSLTAQPSFQDHGGVPYGVLEHMQPLGERPSTRVKTRVKSEKEKKSVAGRSSAAVGLDGTQETPEGTPAPPAPSQPRVDTPPPPAIVVDDEKDDDYAPKANGKKKERAVKSRAIKRHSESGRASTGPPGDKKTAAKAKHQSTYGEKKLRNVVEEAKRRALESNKPDLAAAVNEIYIQSLQDPRLTVLLEAILTQKQSQEQLLEFQEYVRKAKRKIRDDKEAAKKARNLPAPETNGTQALPLRSPSKFTPAESELEKSVIPSTESNETPARKLSIKVKSPSKSSGRRRHGQSSRKSKSPSKKRNGSMSEHGSDSELTELEEISEDGMDVDEPQEDGVAGPSSKVNGKDHAAERGSLAVQGRNLKRSSADAEILEDERDRIISSKKQKLSEGLSRSYDYSESDMRSSVARAPASSKGKRVANGGLVPPRITLQPNGSRSVSARGSRAASTDLDSPLSSPALSSRRSTPHVPKPKTTGKRAKTKTS